MSLDVMFNIITEHWADTRQRVRNGSYRNAYEKPPTGRKHKHTNIHKFSTNKVNRERYNRITLQTTTRTMLFKLELLSVQRYCFTRSEITTHTTLPADDAASASASSRNSPTSYVRVGLFASSRGEYIREYTASSSNLHISPG